MKKYIIGFACVLAIIAAIFYFTSLNKIKESASIQNLSIGDCKSTPSFVQKYKKVGQNASFETNNKEKYGLNLLIRNANNEIIETIQDESWKIGGVLGNFVFDANSNIYLVPTPSINTLRNKENKRNTVYKVDATTGKMEEYIDIKANTDDYKQNPFGLMGIAINCQTKTMYLSSVSGSNPQTEKGAVFSVNLQSKEQKKILENKDIYGIGVTKTHLLLAPVGEPVILSLEQANTNQKPKTEFRIDYSQSIRITDIVKKIKVIDEQTLSLSAIPFAYSLAPINAQLGETVVNYQFKNNTWSLKP